MGVGAEVELAAAAIADMRVKLGRGEVGVAEHLLNAAQVGAAFEEVGRERVPEQVRVDALGVEAGFLGKPAQDQEDARAGEAAALGVEEELGTSAPVEVWPASREVAPERVGCRPAERHDPLLAALPGRPDDALFEIDVHLPEADELTHAEAGSVEQLDQRPVAQRSRRRTDRGVDQTFGLGGREGARELARLAGQGDCGCRVVRPAAEENQMSVERPRCGRPTGDRRGRAALGPELGELALEIFRRGRVQRLLEPGRDVVEVAAVGVDGTERPRRGEERQEAFHLGISRGCGHPA